METEWLFRLSKLNAVSEKELERDHYMRSSIRASTNERPQNPDLNNTTAYR